MKWWTRTWALDTSSERMHLCCVRLKDLVLGSEVRKPCQFDRSGRLDPEEALGFAWFPQPAPTPRNLQSDRGWGSVRPERARGPLDRTHPAFAHFGAPVAAANGGRTRAANVNSHTLRGGRRHCGGSSSSLSDSGNTRTLTRLQQTAIHSSSAPSMAK